jgi:hypothetical protein
MLLSELEFGLGGLSKRLEYLEKGQFVLLGLLAEEEEEEVSLSLRTSTTTTTTSTFNLLLLLSLPNLLPFCTNDGTFGCKSSKKSMKNQNFTTFIEIQLLISTSLCMISHIVRSHYCTHTVTQ